MRLYEEFKEYETLWEKVTTDELEDKVYKLRDNLEDVEFDYDGFEIETCKDGFDPGSWYGHTQTCGTAYIPDFTYTVDAVDVLYALEDSILPKDNKHHRPVFLDPYYDLEVILDNAKDEKQRTEAGLHMDHLLVKHFDELVDWYYRELKDYFADEAYDWAYENVEPEENDFY